MAHFTRSFIVGLVEALCFSECVLGIRVQVQNFYFFNCMPTRFSLGSGCFLHEGFGFVDKV